VAEFDTRPIKDNDVDLARALDAAPVGAVAWLDNLTPLAMRLRGDRGWVDRDGSVLSGDDLASSWRIERITWHRAAAEKSVGAAPEAAPRSVRAWADLPAEQRLIEWNDLPLRELTRLGAAFVREREDATAYAARCRSVADELSNLLHSTAEAADA